MFRYLKDTWPYWLIIIGLALRIIFMENNYDSYPNEVTAHLVSVENPNDNRVLLGYTGRNIPVYNKATVPYVVCTYEYEVDGITYSYSTKSLTTGEDTLLLRYKDNPSTFIIDYR